jgi:hypothetical protein
MTLTLSKILERAWRDIGFSVDIFATGGSATTIVDANTQYTADDSLIGGTAVITKTTDGASPQGKFARISDFVASTFTFTIATVTDAVGAGDAVLLATPSIKLPQMIQAVNDGLANLGTISLVDTSITLANGAYSYNLPVGLKIKKLIDILIPNSDGMYRSIKGLVQNFPSAPAATGTLQFTQIPDEQTIKIVYEGAHPYLSAYSDVVSETIQEELAVAAAIDKALTWYVSKRGDSALGTFTIQRWNDAKQALQMQKAEKPIYRTQPAVKWFIP